MLADALRESFDWSDATLANTRAHLQAKAAAAATAAQLIGGTPDGNPVTRENYGQAQEQYKANRGWVWACVRLIATRVAGQPICVAKQPRRALRTAKSVGDTEALPPLDQHPLLDLLADPNPLMVAPSLMFITVASLELTGRSIWWVTTDGGRRVIMPIPTTWIEEVDSRRTVWTIRPAGSATTIPIPGDQIVHYYYPDPEFPWQPLSPLQQIAHAVEIDQAIAESQYRSFQAVMPRMALRVGKVENIRPTVTKAQRQQLINSLKSAYAGVVGQNEPLILDGLIEDVFKLSLAPGELDYLNSSKLTKARILQGYGVSPILLGEVEGANRASATVADEIFVANKINPLIQLLSACMTEWLGPIFAGPGGQLAVWIEPAVPRDEDMKLKRWQVAATLGYVDESEFRRAVLNLPDRKKPSKPAADDKPEPDAAPVVGEQAVQTVPEMTLNGAQIAAASEIVAAVAHGDIPRDSGIGQLEVLLNLTTEQAERIMGTVGNGFTAPPSEKSWIDLLTRDDLDPFTMQRLDGGKPWQKSKMS
jgi:phage portal protein BeeE